DAVACRSRPPWGGKPPASVAGVADQLLLLASEQNQDRAEHGEDEGHRLVEEIRHDHALPCPFSGDPLDCRLQIGERGLVDVRPGRSDATEIQRLVRDRLGTVVHQKYEAQGKAQQADEAKDEANHDLAVPDARSPVYRLPRPAPLFNYAG